MPSVLAAMTPGSKSKGGGFGKAPIGKPAGKKPATEVKPTAEELAAKEREAAKARRAQAEKKERDEVNQLKERLSKGHRLNDQELAQLEADLATKKVAQEIIGNAQAAFKDFESLFGDLRNMATGAVGGIGNAVTDVVVQGRIREGLERPFEDAARSVEQTFSDTFAGIDPGSAPMFLLMEFLGMGLAVAAARVLQP